MKSTGVIRKIDELGRIVIPKEIRKKLHIEANDDLEIFIDYENIILKKYIEMEYYKKENNKLISIIDGLVDAEVYLSDKEKIVSSGFLEGKKLPSKYIFLMKERKNYQSEYEESISFEGALKKGFLIFKPIIKDSNLVGSIIMIKSTKLLENDILISNIIQKIIENN